MEDVKIKVELKINSGCYCNSAHFFFKENSGSDWWIKIRNTGEKHNNDMNIYKITETNFTPNELIIGATEWIGPHILYSGTIANKNSILYDGNIDVWDAWKQSFLRYELRE